MPTPLAAVEAPRAEGCNREEAPPPAPDDLSSPEVVRPEDHVRLVRFALRGLTRPQDEDDDVAAGVLVLVRCAEAWNAGRVVGCGWASYATRRVRWEWIRRNFNRGKPRRVLEVPFFLEGADEEDEVERPETATEDPGFAAAAARADVALLLEGLDPRARYVLERRFGFRGEAATFARIGAELGLSAQGAKAIEKRALARVRKRAAGRRRPNVYDSP